MPSASLRAPLLAAVLVLAAPAAHCAPVDLPAPVQQVVPEWRPLGDGRLRWFGLHIWLDPRTREPSLRARLMGRR